MNKATIIFSIAVVVSLIGCTAMGHRQAASDDPNGVWVPIKETAARGQQNINRIDLGMTKTQVQNIMGTTNHYYATAHRKPTIITHPSKREMFESNSRTFEVLYYYTRYAKRDAALTPVVLQEGKVVGWGWNYFNKIK
ncbi:MAG: hypothetical protein BMS9Abin36_1559 [Gammaproteobacteria bacterium]|nr:MAG: hypothetical protein BMS9Abin36_1559 [Gammaproteobacteria bacterium]